MDDLTYRKEVLQALKDEYNRRKAWETGGMQLAWIEKAVNSVPSAQPMDVQEAYYRGKIDGIKECTARLKSVTKELDDGRSEG